jgi:hypothetical protein
LGAGPHFPWKKLELAFSDVAEITSALTRLQCAQKFKHPFIHTSFSFLYEQKFRFSTCPFVFLFLAEISPSLKLDAAAGLIVVHVVDVIELQHYKQGSFHLSSLFFLLVMLLLVTCF